MTTRSALILAAAVTGLLAACGPAASDDAPPAPTSVTSTSAATTAFNPEGTSVQTAPAPRPNEGFDWYTRANMDRGQSTMRLAYEVPDSGDQPMGINCLRGSGTLKLDHQSASTGVSSIVLSSEGVTRTYPVSAVFQEEMGGDFLTFDLPGTDPVLTAFRRTGWLTMTVGDHTQNLVAQPDSGSRQRIDDFFSYCLTQE